MKIKTANAAPKVPAISSDFSILDVKKGRKALEKLLGIRNGDYHVPVTITGFIKCAWGSDDGRSTEFAVDVTDLKVGKAEPADG